MKGIKIVIVLVFPKIISSSSKKVYHNFRNKGKFRTINNNNEKYNSEFFFIILFFIEIF